MPKFLIHFAHKHFDFRLPEIESIAKIEGIEIKFERQSLLESSPFFIIEMKNENSAERLLRRSILIKSITLLLAIGSSFTDLTEKLQKRKQEFLKDFDQKTFKFHISSFGHSIPAEEKMSRIQSFSWMELNGGIDMISPDLDFKYIEEYQDYKKSNVPDVCYFGLLVGVGQGSKIVSKLDLKKRNYVGTTSMDAELSLISANQALVRPGTIAYDPFVGTGSFIVAATYFGAHALGSDIDGRKIRGELTYGIQENLKQYGLEQFLMANMACDIAHHCWRAGVTWFDSIICDPPYGVREGAKKISSTDLPNLKRNGEKRIVPRMEPYQLTDIINDLISFSAEYLNMGGRLVFWLPTVTDLYQPQDIPSHPCLTIIANSEQKFGSWSRRLITMEKNRPFVKGETALRIADAPLDESGHANFRDFYFKTK